MKIAFIAPSDEEMQPFLRLLKDVKKWQKGCYLFAEGDFLGHKVMGALCGIGKVNASVATAVLIETFAPDCVIVGGVCGAIDDRLNVGDAILCDEVKHHDVLDRFLTKNPPFFKSATFFADKQLLQKIKQGLFGQTFDFKLYYGRLATGEQFIEDDGREEIKSTVCPLGVDMETAAVAQACTAFGVKFLALRTVTDTPKERGLTAFEKNLEKATQNQGIVLKFIFDYLIA